MDEHTYNQSFREQAEHYLDEQGGRLRGYTNYSNEELLHELQVHQIELELQNDELKSSQQRLQQERSKYSALFNLAPIGYFSLDKQGFIKEMNYAAEHMLDRNLENVSGSKFTDYIYPEDQDLFYFHFQDILKYGKGKPREIRLIRPDSSNFFVRIQSATIKDAAQGISIFMAVIDITEMIDAQNKLKSAKIEAEAASRAKGQFLANMSHEIRTPMNGILGMLEIAMMADLPLEQMDHLKLAKTAADNLLNILNDILDLSKIEAKKLSLQNVEFEPAEVITGAARLLSVTAWRKGVELVAAVDPKLPDTLIGDPVRLKQVLFNLLSNAVKFTDEGEIQIHLAREDGASAGKERIKFICRDSGIGIPPQKIDRLFKSFTQADEATTRKYGGTGLGLAISAKLVEMMGGTLEVESAEGRGSTFSFAIDLPRAAENASKLSEPDELLVQQVVLSEDHDLSQRVAKTYLESFGLPVVDLPLRLMQPGEIDALKQKISEKGAPESQLSLMSGSGEQLEELLSQFSEDSLLSRVPVVIACYPPECGDFRGRLSKYNLRRVVEKPISQVDLRHVLEELFSSAAGKADQQTEAAVSPLSPADVILPTILVAEDNDINMKVLSDFFEQKKWKLVKCRNGREALEAFLSQPSEFDAVLMDIQMPIMDGYDAISKLRSEAGAVGSRVPIIAMTAYAMSSDRERCYRVGADDYVTKPIPSMEKLAELIERNIRTSGHRQSQSGTVDELKVVVAEDENINRMFLQRILKKEGHRVYEAKDGESALALVLKELPDIVVLDLKLPKKDGLSIVKELFENRRTAAIPILIISGRSTDEIENEELPENVAGFLSKPVDSSTLLAYIDKSSKRKVRNE